MGTAKGREIKFRVFDLYKKEMVRVGVDSNASFNFDGSISTYGVLGANPIMQFTGLTDKNGVEIYEGDVTEFAGNKCEIRYYEKLAAFGFYFPHNNTWLHFWECDEGMLRVEIIGNLYTNPELLNQ